MYTIKKILVPTDFSENASSAYNPAQQIAGHFGAKVDLMHVIPTMRYFNESISNLGLPFNMEEDLYPRVQKESENQLEAIAEDYIREENRGRSIVHIAPKPSKAITNYAKEEGYDLILLSATGKHESDLFKGSITEKIVRYSEVPVLTTDRPGLEDTENILFPTDGSDISFRAMPLAISMARIYDASITMYYVDELHGAKIENLEPTPTESESEEIHEALLEGLGSYFEHSWDQAEVKRWEGFKDTLSVSEGDETFTIDMETVIEKSVSAHNAITRYAADNADMVTMTTHGQTGLAHLLLGSTAEKVVQHLKLPVITVKPDLEDLD